jgi:hypothetical protein
MDKVNDSFEFFISDCGSDIDQNSIMVADEIENNKDAPQVEPAEPNVAIPPEEEIKPNNNMQCPPEEENDSQSLSFLSFKLDHAHSIQEEVFPFNNI